MVTWDQPYRCTFYTTTDPDVLRALRRPGRIQLNRDENWDPWNSRTLFCLMEIKTCSSTTEAIDLFTHMRTVGQELMVSRRPSGARTTIVFSCRTFVLDILQCIPEFSGYACEYFHPPTLP